MSEPIAYRIVRNIQSVLAAITVAGGYHYDVAATAVKLDPDHDVQTLVAPNGPRPFLILDVLPETWRYSQAEQVKLVMPITVHWIGESDPTVDEDRQRMFFRACADVEQALAADIGRTGLAADTRVIRQQLIENVEGPQVWAQIQVEVHLHRTYGRPNG